MSAHRDYTEIALTYAEGVVAGKIPAGRLARLACQRHLTDLASAEDPSYPYRYCPDAAHRFCAFVEAFPHVAAKWARAKEKLILAPWQVFVFACVFGWLRRLDGLRRFRRVYIEVPRKNGKSTMLAALALYMATEEDETGAEVYCGATTEKQAQKVFEPAQKMARQTPDFLEYYGVEVLANAVVCESTGSTLQPMIGNPGDGDSPSCAIIDEYHEHRTSTQYDTMMTGMGAREQPLLIVITTAGLDLASPCYAHHLEVKTTLEGAVTDDSLFGIIYSYDRGTDVSWDSDDAIKQANPCLGYSVSMEYLQEQRARAQRSSRYTTTYKTKHLNEWCQSREQYFTVSAWQALDRDIDLSQYAQRPCILGLDLASKRDLCALQVVFREDDGSYRSFSFFWLSEDRAKDVKSTPYLEWRDDKHITLTPGATTDHEAIKNKILELYANHQVLEVAYDPTQASYMAKELAGEGVNMIEHPQNTNKLSEPMKALDGLIMEGQIHHDGNPVMTWNISNVVGKTYGHSLVRPHRETEEAKIDGAVSLIMALGRWMAQEEDTGSVYEERGILVL